METIKCKNLIHFFKTNINCASVTEIVMGPTVVTFPLEFSSKTPHHEYNTKFIIHMISTNIPYSRVTCNITQMDCVCEDSVIKSDLRVVFTVNQQWIYLNEVYVRLRFGVLRACSHLPHPYSLSNRDKECRLFFPASCSPLAVVLRKHPNGRPHPVRSLGQRYAGAGAGGAGNDISAARRTSLPRGGR